MKLKLVIITVAMTVAGAAVAGPGCGKGHSKQVMSCSDGMVWDTQSQTCVPQVTS